MGKKTISSLDSQKDIKKDLAFPVEDGISTKKMTMETLLDNFLKNLNPAMADYVVNQEEIEITDSTVSNEIIARKTTNALCTKTKEGVITISGTATTNKSSSFKISFPEGYKMKDENYSAVAMADPEDITCFITKSKDDCTFETYSTAGSRVAKKGKNFDYTIRGKNRT
jgi:hypothetical protein